MITAMSTSSVSSAATVAVDKATSDLLIGPDWTMNIDICDSVNSHRWQAKDVVKAVKRRLQHKNPKIQLLALTLLETMVKNCGDYLHFQVAEKNIVGEMVKIVKKKTDMLVRDKILVLLDSWQEAFGGPGGKYPQYYWAYEELRRSGVQFPQRSLDSSPIFTPPVTHPTFRQAQAGYGMPSNSSRRLDETMATDEGLSLSSLDSMHNVLELLNDMLQAVNPSDRQAVKDELIVDLVNQCRSNQKKLMQMLTTTGDEELLGKGLELNDTLQILLAKHDAIASGTPVPTQVASMDIKPHEGSLPSANQVEGSLPSAKTAEVQCSSSKPNGHPSAPATNIAKHQIDEEDEEDDFAQLARRHSKGQTSPSQSTSGTSGPLVQANSAASSTASSSNLNTCTDVALADPPAPVRTSKEQDMIDLLSLALTTVSTSPHTHDPSTSPYPNQTTPQVPASSGSQGYPYGSQTYSGDQLQVSSNSYVVPWAQPQPQKNLQPSPPPPLHSPHPNHFQSPSEPSLQPLSGQHFQHSSQASLQNQPQQHTQPSLQPQARQYFQHPQQPTFQAQPQQPTFQAQLQQPPFQAQSQQPTFQAQSQQPTFQAPPQQPESQHQFQPRHQQQSPSQPQSRQQFQLESSQQLHPQFQPQLLAQPQYSTAYIPPPWAATPGYANGRHHMPAASNIYSSPEAPQAARPMQHYNSFSTRANNGFAMNGDPLAAPEGPRNPPASGGQKPFIPSYRLFEDLNVLGNADGKFRMAGKQPGSLSGNSGQRMIGMQK